MAANDKIVLNANFAEWRSVRADGLDDDPWLYYCLEQFLKPYALDDEETEYGITEGGGDGGADGVYFLVNHRHLVTEETSLDADNVSKIKLIIFQIKRSGGFKPTEIEKWLLFTEDFLDLSKDPDKFGKRYNEKIKTMMRVWRSQYLRVAAESPDLSVDYYYITGDDVWPDEYADDACGRVRAKVDTYLRGAACQTHCVGAKEIWDQVQRRPPKKRILQWNGQQPVRTKDGAVGLIKLTDFAKFLEDEPGVLAERIFESNVRGFQPQSSVNDDIAKTLADHSKIPNFWLLNNGVTIITPKIGAVDHISVSIEDAQIVNGLQTSRAIFDYISTNATVVDDREVLVRVIETGNNAVNDQIIKATNSQNKMQPASLRMTDQIHRDLEEVFKKVGLFYDRRKGHYKDLGKPVNKIISVNTVAQAVISILLQRPDDARARPGNYFRDDDKYESIFANSKIPLGAYLACTQIFQHVERWLATNNVQSSDRKNIKYYLTAFVVRDLTGLENPVGPLLPSITNIDENTIAACQQRVERAYLKLSETTDRDSVAKGASLLKRLNANWRKRSLRKKSSGGRDAKT